MKLERVFLMMLIEKLSLEQVEYKPFNEVCEYIRGITYNKSQEAKEENEKNWKVLRANNIDLQRKVLDLRDVKEVDSSVKVKESQRLRKNDILICAGSGSKEHIGKVAFITEDMDYTFGGFMAVIRVISEKINSRFLFHILAGNLFSEFLAKKLNVSTINNLNSSLIKNFQIPLPPLPIQQEIVRILDTFTNFTAELTDKLNAELTARRKQYEYYRDELLTFGEDVPVTTFGEVSTIFRGASPRPIKDYITDDIDGINWIKIGDVRPGTKYITDTAEKITKEGAKKSRFVYKGDFILSNSMSFGRPYIIKKTGCIHDGWLSISEFEEHYSTDFLYHLLSSHKYQSIMKRKASFGGAVQNLNADIVKSLELPIISLNEQRRIVSMLDKFDVICSDICAGLPAEIEARQRQYEYYRGQLLKFDN